MYLFNHSFTSISFYLLSTHRSQKYIRLSEYETLVGEIKGKRFARVQSPIAVSANRISGNMAAILNKRARGERMSPRLNRNTIVHAQRVTTLPRRQFASANKSNSNTLSGYG